MSQGYLHHSGREASQLCHMQPEALVASSWAHTVEQSEGLLCCQCSHMTIGDCCNGICHRRHLVEMSGKETETADLSGNVAALCVCMHERDASSTGYVAAMNPIILLGDGPCQPKPIVGGRASAQLIDDDQ